jgi:hypothetical protein
MVGTERYLDIAMWVRKRGDVTDEARKLTSAREKSEQKSKRNKSSQITYAEHGEYETTT